MSDIYIWIADRDGEGDWEKIDKDRLDLAEHDYEVRAEVIEKCAEIMSHISNICGACCPAHCHWGTELTCKDAWKEYLMEQIKEQKNE